MIEAKRPDEGDFLEIPSGKISPWWVDPTTSLESKRWCCRRAGGAADGSTADRSQQQRHQKPCYVKHLVAAHSLSRDDTGFRDASRKKRPEFWRWGIQAENQRRTTNRPRGKHETTLRSRARLNNNLTVYLHRRWENSHRGIQWSTCACNWWRKEPKRCWRHDDGKIATLHNVCIG